MRVRGLVRSQLTVRKRGLDRMKFYAPATSQLQWYELVENGLKNVGFDNCGDCQSYLKQ